MTDARLDGLEVHVLMACHNRRALTVRAVTSALVVADAGVDLRVWVYDDGSTDGTGAALRALDERVTVLDGTGTEYWARSMAAAETAALRQASERAVLLWLNDDVAIDDGALATLLATGADHPDAIVVGATRGPGTGDLTYSGMRRARAHPLSFERVVPGLDVQPVDTFNGNAVVVPAAVARSLGGIDGDYAHGMADIDYGLRARRAGVPVLLAGTVGACARNAEPAGLTLAQRWRRFTGVKGAGHPRSLARLLRRASGPAWPWWWLATYPTWLVRRGRP